MSGTQLITKGIMRTNAIPSMVAQREPRGLQSRSKPTSRKKEKIVETIAPMMIADTQVTQAAATHFPLTAGKGYLSANLR